MILLLQQSLETLDSGKPFKDCVEDIQGIVELFKYYAGWCDKICGKTIPVGKQVIREDHFKLIEEEHEWQNHM